MCVFVVFVFYLKWKKFRISNCFDWILFFFSNCFDWILFFFEVQKVLKFKLFFDWIILTQTFRSGRVVLCWSDMFDWQVSTPTTSFWQRSHVRHSPAAFLEGIKSLPGRGICYSTGHGYMCLICTALYSACHSNLHNIYSKCSAYSPTERYAQ